MKNLKTSSAKLSVLKYSLLAFFFIFFSSCQQEEIPDSQDLYSQDAINEDFLANLKNNNSIQISSNGMSFDAPTEILSGWTTFQYENNTALPHFFVLEKLPEGKTVEDSKAEIVPIFQKGMDFFNDYNFEDGLAAFGELPAWFYDIIFTGGPGIIDGGKTAQTTVWLEPGYYVIECYIKTPGGTFHSAIGMIEGIRVEDQNNGQKVPKPSFEVNISAAEGISVQDKIRPGMHTIGVTFEDQAVYGNFLGHDVHLVKLNDEANINELNAWMNWADPAQFKTPPPNGIEFLGGTQELPAGKTSYFTTLLKPGTYAFVAEIPDPRSKGMLKVFTVPE